VSSSDAGAVTPPAPPPPAAPKKRGVFRRLYNLVVTLTLLGALAFGGGVWYSRVNDNFHDFFTEYIPFGEQAVLYLEEMDFRKRFPNISNRIPGGRPRDTGDSVKIPAQSGASWRVADSGEPAGRQSSALSRKQPATPAAEKTKDEAPKQTKSTPGKKEEPKAEAPKAPQPAAAPPAAAAEPPKPVTGAVPVQISPAAEDKSAAPAFQAPEVDEPSRWPPAAPIDPLLVHYAADPVVLGLVRMLNDIIAVINADKANEKYGATIGKAKEELMKIGTKIQDMKMQAEISAAATLEERTKAFDKMATELVDRAEAAMLMQEARWRQQFEEEAKKLHESYEERVRVMTERERQLSEEKLGNRLLEQAVELSRQFSGEVRGRVEEERDGRLAKLGALSSEVSELEKLAAGWTDVVDANLRTQQLHVAVEAVRASLEDPHQRARPFVRELVALKEIANEDAVVDAAIASINPSAYQRGLPAPADLVDRFRRVAAEVRKASLLPDDAGVASHASSWVLSKVLFKKQGLAAGDDVESILTRTQTYLEEGDLDNAAREMNGLRGWAKTLSRDWIGEVRKVLEVQQALDVGFSLCFPSLSSILVLPTPLSLSLSLSLLFFSFFLALFVFPQRFIADKRNTQVIATEARLQSLKVD